MGFGVTADPAAAIVILTDADGKALPPGTAVTLDGQDQSYVVGFDGEAYITGLGADNKIESTSSNVACAGGFKFSAAKNQQQVIGPVKCS